MKKILILFLVLPVLAHSQQLSVQVSSTGKQNLNLSPLIGIIVPTGSASVGPVFRMYGKHVVTGGRLFTSTPIYKNVSVLVSFDGLADKEQLVRLELTPGVSVSFRRFQVMTGIDTEHYNPVTRTTKRVSVYAGIIIAPH